MAKRIDHSPNAYPRIKDTSKTFEKVDFAPIAEELGAKEVSGQVLASAPNTMELGALPHSGL